jgi:hypothetical protein
MVYYHQRERRLNAVIPGNSIVQCDTSIALSKTGSMSPSPDFDYHENGSIDILRPGIYVVFWFVAGMVGFATDGQSYQLKKFDYDTQNPDWTVLAGASTHIKISAFSGFGTVAASVDEISEHGKVTVALFNTADSAIQLTFFQPKAGILIYGLDLASLESRITNIENFVYLANFSEIWSLTPELSGLGIGVIHTGYTHSIWGLGSLNHQQTLVNGEIYYLITSSQYPALLLSQGDAEIGTLWIETPTGNLYSTPIRFDETGIFFKTNNQLTNLPIGTTFKFAHTLLLVDPDHTF